jgi:translation elongation factor EF-G
VEVVTERIWNYCDKLGAAAHHRLHRMDRERADFNRVLESLTNAFGRTVPRAVAHRQREELYRRGRSGRMKAYTYEMGGNGKGKVGPIPATWPSRPRPRTSVWWNWLPKAMTR